MDSLKPCPFCGGKQTYRKHDGGVWLTTTNHKRGCIMRDALAFVAYRTEAEAIEAWNSRAELTCEYVIEDNMNESEGNGDVWFHCTNCGTCYDYEVDDWLIRMPYCPNCGAKVVGE